MDPRIWGPKLWFISHAIAFNYPDKPTDQEKEAHRKWFELYKDIIMCEVCRNHYREHYAEDPVENHLENKEQLIKWVWNLHNAVNESIGKNKWSFEQMMEHYNEIFGNKCTIKANKCSKTKKADVDYNLYILIFMNVIILLILLSFLLTKKNIL